ncbi:calponin homology domain-containing protein [Paenibacillus silvisoli]|uniref:hypothetical protein n=1 Tax=Paenibacillus silvisoli TaxID=3110539 RepID=UPI002803954B|nr:hypothetical protein [Paenibacillus silvisoli]
MKRYWFTTLLMLFIVACIGSYYVSAALKSYPDYRLVVESGDDKEADTVILHGEAGIGSLEITSKGSHYRAEESFFQSFAASNRFIGDPDLLQLLKDHRNFMRGKQSTNGFYKDNQVLAYAEIRNGDLNADGSRNFKLYISAQDMEKKTNASFELDVPAGKAPYGWVYVTDVQLIGSELRVLTVNSEQIRESSPFGYLQEIHSYAIDWTNQRIVSDKILLQDKKMDDGQVMQYSSLNAQQSSIAPQEVQAYRQTTSKMVKDQDGNEYMKSGTDAVITYNLKTGQMEAVPLLEADNVNSEHVYATEDAVIALSQDGNNVRIKRYDLQSKAITEFTVPGSVDSNNMVIKDRLYMYSLNGQNSRIVSVDLTKGKVVFTGSIDVNEQGAERAKLLKRLQVYSIYPAV